MANINFRPAGEEFDDYEEFGGFDLGDDDYRPTESRMDFFTPPTTPATTFTTSTTKGSSFGGFGTQTKRSKLVHFPTASKSSAAAAVATSSSQSNSATMNGHCEEMVAGTTPSLSPRSPRKSPQLIPVDDFRLAVTKNNHNAVGEMLDSGLEVDTLFHSGWTPLMYAASCGHPETVRLLLERGADPNFHKDQYTVLMGACASTHDNAEHILQCVNRLIEKGAQIDSFDRYHMSPMMYATREGRATVVKRLIDLGANINKQDTRGYTALMWATCRGHTRVAHVLLEGGADVTLRCSDGSRAADLAFLQGQKQVERLLTKFKDGVRIDEGDLVQDTIQKTSASSENSSNGCVYGELELFLSGLDLGILISTFQKNQVNFAQFLRMTDKDLQQLDIHQMGVRKKILDAIHQTHKHEWKTSSLTSIQYNKQLSCAEAVAMLANIKKHASYIGSTIGYVSDQIHAHKDILLNAADPTSVQELCVHTNDALTNVKILYEELTVLRKHLNEVTGKEDFTPPDLIGPKSHIVQRGNSKRRAFAALGAAIFCTAVWQRGSIMSALSKITVLNT